MNAINNKNELYSLYMNDVSNVNDEIKQIENIIALCMNNNLHCVHDNSQKKKSKLSYEY